MRDHLYQFANAMETKLKTKDAEHGEAGWMDRTRTIRQLKGALTVEMRELYEAFDNCNPEELAARCISAANYAMMIHNRLRYHPPVPTVPEDFNL